MAPCDTLVGARYFYLSVIKADSSERPSHKCIIMHHNMLHHETLASNYMTSSSPSKRKAFCKVRKGVSSSQHRHTWNSFTELRYTCVIALAFYVHGSWYCSEFGKPQLGSKTFDPSSGQAFVLSLLYQVTKSGQRCVLFLSVVKGGHMQGQQWLGSSIHGWRTTTHTMSSKW